MRLFASDIKKLQMLSVGNFKKQICAACGEEFYSFRDCLYCHQACKQMAYRKRLLNNNDTEIKLPPITVNEDLETKPPTLQKISFDDKELDEKIEKYTNNLNQIKYGRQ